MVTDKDREFIEKIKTIGVIVKTPERLPYGTGSRGRYITSEETGGHSILIPSFGALEKEEVDYVAEAAIEEERDRVAKKQPSEKQQALRNIVVETLKAPKGKRKATMDKIIEEGMV